MNAVRPSLVVTARASGKRSGWLPQTLLPLSYHGGKLECK